MRKNTSIVKSTNKTKSADRPKAFLKLCSLKNVGAHCKFTPICAKKNKYAKVLDINLNGLTKIIINATIIKIYNTVQTSLKTQSGG